MFRDLAKWLGIKLPYEPGPQQISQNLSLETTVQQVPEVHNPEVRNARNVHNDEITAAETAIETAIKEKRHTFKPGQGHKTTDAQSRYNYHLKAGPGIGRDDLVFEKTGNDLKIIVKGNNSDSWTYREHFSKQKNAKLIFITVEEKIGDKKQSFKLSGKHFPALITLQSAGESAGEKGDAIQSLRKRSYWDGKEVLSRKTAAENLFEFTPGGNYTLKLSGAGLHTLVFPDHQNALFNKNLFSERDGDDLKLMMLGGSKSEAINVRVPGYFDHEVRGKIGELRLQIGKYSRLDGNHQIDEQVQNGGLVLISGSHDGNSGLGMTGNSKDTLHLLNHESWPIQDDGERTTGHYTLREYGGSDTLRFESLSREELVFEKSGEDLKIWIGKKGSAASVTVEGQFSRKKSKKVERIEAGGYVLLTEKLPSTEGPLALAADVWEKKTAPSYWWLADTDTPGEGISSESLLPEMVASFHSSADREKRSIESCLCSPRRDDMPLAGYCYSPAGRTDSLLGC